MKYLLKGITTKLVAGGVAVAATATMALLVTAPSSQAGGIPSEAYGFAANGPIPIEPMPTISSDDGKTHSESMGEAPENPLLALKAATVTAGDDTASVELANIAIGGSDLLQYVPEPPKELTDACTQLTSAADGVIDQATGGAGGDAGNPLEEATDQVTDQVTGGDGGSPTDALPLPSEIEGVPDLPGLDLNDISLADLCDALVAPKSILGLDLVRVWCDGNTGGVDVGGLKLLGQAVDIPSTDPNTAIPADPLAHITINKQTKNADGSFSVTGVEINLGGGAQIISLGHAKCGKFAADPAPAPAPAAPDPVKPAPAPAPEPVREHVPVTG